MTGLNGSGKSHLLEAIFNNTQNVVLKDGEQIKNILYIPFNGLNPKIEENCDPARITSFVKEFYSQFKNALKNPNFQKNKIKSTLLQTFYDPNQKLIAKKFIDKIDINLEDVDENYLIDIFDVSMMS